jgi:hypothetical protein
MIMNPAELGPENECFNEAKQKLETTVTTSTKPQLSDSKKNLVMGPRWVPDTKKN